MNLFLLSLFCVYSLIAGRILTIEDFGGKTSSTAQQEVSSPLILTVFFIILYKGIPDSLINNDILDHEPIVYPEFLHSDMKLQPTKKMRNRRISLAVHDDSIDKKSGQQDQLLQIAINNTKAFNLALLSASPGDTILLREHESYSFLGGVHGAYMDGVTIDFAGYTRFIYDRSSWPMKEWDGGITYNETMQYVPAIYITNSSNIVLTCSAKEKALVMVDYDKNQIYIDNESGSGGIIDGHGKKWWEDSIMGVIEVESRPRLVDIRSCVNVTMEFLTLVNSPYWTVTLESIGAEVHHVNVLVDRNYQRSLINTTTARIFPPFAPEDFIDMDTIQHVKRYLRTNKHFEKFHFPDIFPSWVLQPLDLNTDGIDPIGRDIYIHDCIVLNDDDSIAVKPPLHDEKGAVLNNTIYYDCTGNITIENMVLTGFGASIGSVGPTKNHPCVDGVIFRNISMPGTGKGIYIKSNQSTCRPKESSKIANIL